MITLVEPGIYQAKPMVDVWCCLPGVGGYGVCYSNVQKSRNVLINTIVVCIFVWASGDWEEKRTLLRQGLYPQMLAFGVFSCLLWAGVILHLKVSA